MNSIELVDSGLIRKEFAGSYLVTKGNETAVIEVSTSHGVEPILNRLKKNSIALESVKYIIVTHIHLDHAGGAGKLLTHLPNAKLIVHPSGAKHMVDPAKLIAGANAVYGEDVVKRDYGEIVPIPEDRIIECKDNQEFDLGDKKFTTIHTPGHARHHISIFDNETSSLFTGDSFGLSYPEMTTDKGRFYQPTTTPTAFEYDKMMDSIKKMMILEPKRVYFTHYGYTDNIEELEKQVTTRLTDYVTLTEKTKDSGENRVKDLEKLLSNYYIKEAKHHGSILSDKEILDLFDIDIKLNAMGLALWFERFFSL